MTRVCQRIGLLLLLLAMARIASGATTPIHVTLDGANAAGAQVFVDAQLQGLTDAQGMLVVDRALLQNNHTLITARLKVYKVSAFLPGHEDADSPAGWVARVYVTSVNIDNSGTVTRFLVTDNSLTQELVLQRDNALIGLQVLASTDWDMSPVEFTRLMETFQKASRYLWNATDGQFVFEKVKISDLTQNWDRSEYRFWADNTLRARTTPGGFLNQNLLGQLVGSFINLSWRDIVIHLQMPVGGWGGEDPRTFVHEFGHLGFSLKDEYSDVLPEACTTRRNRDAIGTEFAVGGPKSACIMDSQFESKKFCSDEGPNSHQYTSQQPDDCWAGIRGSFSDPQGARWILKTPVTRNQIVGDLTGASGTITDAFPLEWNTSFSVTNQGWPTTLCAPFIQTAKFANGSLAGLATIKLLYTSIDPSQHSWMSEGKTFDSSAPNAGKLGELSILGAHVSDTVMTETEFVPLASCPFGSWPEGPLGVSTADTDGDHIPDAFDSCPTRFNPLDLDTSGWPVQPAISCGCKSNAECPGGLLCADAGGGAGLQCESPICHTNDDCGAGRECKAGPAGGACVSSAGQHCKSNAECGTGSCDAGDGTSKTGLCVPARSRGMAGMLCTDDRQCSSGNCNGLRPDGAGGWRPGVCSTSSVKTLGDYCFNSAQCSSGYCDAGIGTSKTNLCMPNRNGSPGDICSDNRQCSSGNCSGLAPGSNGTWQPGACGANIQKALGEYCFGNGDCASGYCDAGWGTSQTNRCMPNKNGTFGQICSNDTQCASHNCSGLSNGGGVVAGTCGLQKTLGSACTANNQCSSGYCDGGIGTSQTYRCMPNKDGKTGDICSNDNQCVSQNCSGLHSDNMGSWVPGACSASPMKALGEYCFGSAQCSTGYCDAGDGTSKTHLCMPNKNGKTGDLCSADNQCVSGNCGGLAPDDAGNWQAGHCSASSQKLLGAYCFGNSQCGSGYCDAGNGTSKTNLCMPNGNGQRGDTCSNNNQCSSRNCAGLHAEGNNWIPGQCQ